MKPTMAPHPLGATLGPAAIEPRRKEPLLVAEIIRLLERHRVPWNQAVREAAGLMAQTVEEAEGWWAFEMAEDDDLTSTERIEQKRSESLHGLHLCTCQTITRGHRVPNPDCPMHVGDGTENVGYYPNRTGR